MSSAKFISLLFRSLLLSQSYNHRDNVYYRIGCKNQPGLCKLKAYPIKFSFCFIIKVQAKRYAPETLELTSRQPYTKLRNNLQYKDIENKNEKMFVKKDNKVSSTKNEINDINVKIIRITIIKRNILVFRNISFSHFIFFIENKTLNTIRKKRKKGKKKMPVSKIIFFSNS